MRWIIILGGKSGILGILEICFFVCGEFVGVLEMDKKCAVVSRFLAFFEIGLGVI
jgi:hypothetical protein